MEYQVVKTKVIGFFVRVAIFLALLVSVGQLSRATVHASWIEPVQVSNVPEVGLVAPIMISVDDSGTLHAIWIQYFSGDQDGTYYAQKQPGQVWSIPELTPLPFRGDNGKMDAVVSPDGTVHLVASGSCCGETWAWVYLSRSPSGQWSEVELANADYAAAGGPSLALDIDGTLHLVYPGKLLGTFDPPQMRYQFKTAGGSWSEMQQISSGAGDAFGGILTVDDTDTLHLAWTQDMDGDQNFQAVYSTLAPGSSWSAFEPIYDGASVAGFVVDSYFAPHLVFLDSARNFDLSYTTRSSDGLWSTPLDLTETPGVVHPSLAITANDILHLVYDNENGSVTYRTKFPGEPWGEPSVAATNATPSGFVVPRITTDTGGHPHVIFGSGDVYYTGEVLDFRELTNLSPADVWVGLKNSDDVGIRFDLLAEVYKNTDLVGSGQLDSVPGGSSGFNNAKLNSIPLTLPSPVPIAENDELSIKLYVRNACVGSGKNSGTARLWYNDGAADSHFDATIDDFTSIYYLISDFLLSNSPGVGPKFKADVGAGAKCSPFKLFGAWNTSL